MGAGSLAGRAVTHGTLCSPASWPAKPADITSTNSAARPVCHWELLAPDPPLPLLDFSYHTSSRKPSIPAFTKLPDFTELHSRAKHARSPGKGWDAGIFSMNEDKCFVIALVHKRSLLPIPLWVAACFRTCRTRLESLALLAVKHRVTLQGLQLKRKPQRLQVWKCTVCTTAGQSLEKSSEKSQPSKGFEG